MSFVIERDIHVSKSVTSDKSKILSFRLFLHAIRFDLNNLQLSRYFQQRQYNSMLVSSSLFLNCSEDVRQLCYDFLENAHITILDGCIRVGYEFNASFYAQRMMPDDSEEAQKVYAATVEDWLKGKMHLVRVIDKLYTDALLAQLNHDVASTPTVKKARDAQPVPVESNASKTQTPILEELETSASGISEVNSYETDDSDVEDIYVDDLPRVKVSNSSSAPSHVDTDSVAIAKSFSSSPSTATPADETDVEIDNELLLPKRSDFEPQIHTERMVRRPAPVGGCSSDSIRSSYGSIWRSVDSICHSKEEFDDVDNNSASPGSVAGLVSPVALN